MRLVKEWKGLYRFTAFVIVIVGRTVAGIGVCVCVCVCVCVLVACWLVILFSLMLSLTLACCY